MSGTQYTTVVNADGTITTFIPFIPPANSQFTFNVTLDGATYTLSVSWNTLSQDWFLNCLDLSQNHIFTFKMNASPDGYDINLIFGYFITSTLVFRGSTGNIEVTN